MVTNKEKGPYATIKNLIGGYLLLGSFADIPNLAA